MRPPSPRLLSRREHLPRHRRDPNTAAAPNTTAASDSTNLRRRHGRRRHDNTRARPRRYRPPHLDATGLLEHRSLDSPGNPPSPPTSARNTLAAAVACDLRSAVFHAVLRAVLHAPCCVARLFHAVFRVGGSLFRSPVACFTHAFHSAFHTGVRLRVRLRFTRAFHAMCTA